MKKILIIADPLEKFNIHGDSTYLLMLTARDMGYQLSYCAPSDIYSLKDQSLANICELELAHGVADIYATPQWFKIVSQLEAVNLTHFDAIMVRNDPPFNLEYYYLTQILELAEHNGVKVINSPRALRNFNEKLTILNFPKHITPTLVSKNKNVIKEFIATHGVCVVKPIDMMAGRGVFRIANDDPNQDPILETITDYFTQSVMVQRFIPEVVAGDKRIFIINGEVVSHCLYRIPQSGQIRGNLAVGGRGEVHPLNEDDYAIANEVAQWLLQEGVQIAGIDVIGKCLTEVNITSPTGAQQIYQQAGINVFANLLSSI